MAPGRDKAISYDPPGAIGITDPTAAILLKFLEVQDTERPRDSAEGLRDLVSPIDTFPLALIAPASVGRGRRFDPRVPSAMVTSDRDPGTTLFTRDVSIQTILSWDAAAALEHATSDEFPEAQAGAIIVRGSANIGAGSGVSYGLQISVEDAPSSTGIVTFFWHDLAGANRSFGAEIQIPPGQFTMLTATRRWISESSVDVCIYVGDVLANRASIFNAGTAGSTTDPTTVGCRVVTSDPDLGDGYVLRYAGIINEIMVTGRVLSLEEIEATWLRITRYQPLGLQLFRECHDRGFPLSDVQDSDAQLDTRMVGHALGYAAASIENMRSNWLPSRAYGEVLDDWVTLTRPTTQPSDDTETLRARVGARLKQRRGASPDGIKDAIGGLLGNVSADLLQFIAFSNRWTDDFTTIDPLRWNQIPLSSASAVSGAASFAPGAGTFRMTGPFREWLTIGATVSQPRISMGGAGSPHAIGELHMGTPTANAESGVWFGDRANGNFVLLGLRLTGTTYGIAMTTFVRFAQVDLIGPVGIGTSNPAAIWLHLREDSAGTWTGDYSLTGPTSGFVSIGSLVGAPLAMQWSGCYYRSVGSAAIASGAAQFNSFTLFTPNGTRTSKAYVYADPAIFPSVDVDASHLVIQGVKHAFTKGTLITRKNFLADRTETGCDRGPTGPL